MATNLNFNIGMLGHVDSGKTSLSKSMSSVASTAAFDKNPQSKQRGITLDLGFSSFTVPAPDHIVNESITHVQYTLVDCPGHASLIRTIIGGAQIIDLMILVVDVVKGMQTQTAECLVIGEIICEKLLVVLNKIDLIPEDRRQAHIEKMSKKMHKTLERTKFVGCDIVPVAANPGGSENEKVNEQGLNIETLIETIKRHTYIPERSPSGPFIFSVDHCFSIRGQGTVMTGTALSGKISVNENVEVPSLKEVKKVKSIQMFRKPINSIQQGDRAGICVTQFEPKLLERGLVCDPGSLPTLYAAVAKISKIPYFSGDVATRSKFHITIGHSTVMARLLLFADSSEKAGADEKMSSWVLKRSDTDCFDFTKEYIYMEKLEERAKNQFVLLEFEKPVTCRRNSLAIGSRLDSDINANKCRLAFQARIVESIIDKDYEKNILPDIKIYKNKMKEGIVDRIQDDYTVICRGLLKKESNIELFQNLKVELSTGEQGKIEGNFGQSGKIKIRIPDGIGEKCKNALGGKGSKKERNKKNQSAKEEGKQPTTVTNETVLLHLKFKRYIFDLGKKMIQT
ncbi:selenocysteine-specific elongation factor-like [Styela clava]